MKMKKKKEKGRYKNHNESKNTGKFRIFKCCDYFMKITQILTMKTKRQNNLLFKTIISTRV